MKKLLLLATTAVVFPTAAFAQSTGSVDFEKETIVVTGTRTQQVGGVQAPDTSKPKAVLTQDMISRQSPGQTILDTINVIPGVSFQSNDAYSSTSGTLTIRGFDSSRVSLTFDGVPLNDSGNYALYSNQQLDPELIEQVNVNLGTTDVDSPTASAVGGTVNYRTRLPSKQFGARLSASAGEFQFHRIFASIDTGEIGPIGTRAFVAASRSVNDNPFNNYGKAAKQQYNARIYQPIGSNGDFLSVAGHYNENRTNFFGSSPLRNDRTRFITVGGVSTEVPRVAGSSSQNRFPSNGDERFYDINYPCRTAVARPGLPDSPVGSSAPNGQPDPNGDFAGCGTEFDRRFNPSNTGNIRGSSRFTLADGIILTVDPSYQYVKANGGGTSTANEYGYDINPALVGTTARSNCSTAAPNPNIVCVPGYFGGSPYFNGVDLNGDGDFKDRVTVLTPSQTQTDRVGVISGLRWDINDDHTVRLTYTYDHASHRQTGEVGLLDSGGNPLDVFPVNNPLVSNRGVALEKRDRQSYAILNQVSGEWRGEFLQDRLTLNAGVRAPYFSRKLDNNCFSSSGANSSGGFVECTGGDPTIDDIVIANNPYTFDPDTGKVTGFAVPQKRTLKYHKLLPSAGILFDITRQVSVFGSYAKGISVPSTDNLYSSFFFPVGTAEAKPKPELTDSYDIGLRYRSSKIQAQIGAWKTKFTNRTAAAFDPELNTTVYRNLGRVDKHGFDASIAYAPIKALTLYAFGSINKSKIKDDIQVGALPVVGGEQTTCADRDLLTVAQERASCAYTGGMSESGAPKYNYGTSILGKLGPVELGVTAKKTGPRYVYDTNSATYSGTLAGTLTEIYPSKTPAYWLVNLDLRYSLADLSPTLSKTFIQMNVYNLFDKFYVGGFGGGLTQSLSGSSYGNPGFVQIGAPRTISGTINFEF